MFISSLYFFSSLENNKIKYSFEMLSFLSSFQGYEISE